MPDDSQRVDQYIARAAPFARPILERVRKVVHRACPDIEERIKWGMPSFEKNGLVCGIAVFKAHATFGFWRGAELEDPAGILRGKDKASFMAEKLTDVSQLPPDRILREYVKRAVELNEKRAKEPKPPPRTRKKKPEAKVPPDLAAALKKNARARATFEKFPPSHR